MLNIPFGKPGFLVFDNHLFSVVPLTLESRIGEMSELTCEVIHEIQESRPLKLGNYLFLSDNKGSTSVKYVGDRDGYRTAFACIDEMHDVRIRPNEIKKVIFNAPATIVIWADGTKTVVKCQPDDEYNAELGLAMAISKKFLGNKGNFNEVFKKWIPETSTTVTEFKCEFKLEPSLIDRIDRIFTKK